MGFIYEKNINCRGNLPKTYSLTSWLRQQSGFSILPAQDPVLKDQVLSGNITHSKHSHVTRKKDPVLNGEHSPIRFPILEQTKQKYKNMGNNIE